MSDISGTTVEATEQLKEQSSSEETTINMEVEDEVELEREKKHHESPFYKDLIKKLPVKSNITSWGSVRDIKCSHCFSSSSTLRKHNRHLLLKHFIRVDEPFTFFCPNRRCSHRSTSSKDIQEHLGAVHPGLIKIRTVYHEIAQSDTKGVPCNVDDCSDMFKDLSAMFEHVRKIHSRQSCNAAKVPENQVDDKVLKCEVEGCTYSSAFLKNLKLHTTKKHGKKRKHAKDETGSDPPNILNTVETESGDIQPNRVPRFKLMKRKFAEEEWSVSKRKKQALEVQSPSKPKIKKVKVRLNPLLVHFDPVQKALIAMSDVHKNLNQEMSRIDGVMEKLITEHSVACTQCQGSPEFMEQRKHLKDHVNIQNEKMEERIKQLEKQLDTMTRSFKKLSYQQKQSSEINYSSLLQGVTKPTLHKKNDYSVVQGYRLVDLNVLRLALQSAQRCGHCNLILTEVNSHLSQVDLATQLGLLCSVCGLQTIFSTSSFSEEDPPNYSVNKIFLPNLGPSAYYSLVNLVQKSMGSVKVNMNRNKHGVSVPHRAKLIVSVDRKPYPLEFIATEPSDDIVRPDLSGSYDNIAEPDLDVSELCETILEGDHKDSKDGVVVDLLENTLKSRADNFYTKTDTKTDAPDSTESDEPTQDLLQLKAEPDAETEQPEQNEPKKEDSVSISHQEGSKGGEIKIVRVQGNVPNFSTSDIGKKLKIKSFLDLQEDDKKPTPEKKHWTTVDGDLQYNEDEGVVGEVVPIPPGSKLYTNDLVYSTPSSSKLPLGIYKVKRANGKETVLVVNEKGVPKKLSEKSTEHVVLGKKNIVTEGSGDNAPKTPLEIFYSEVMRALKKKLPNIGNAQLERIVIDKWTKMNFAEKQVYRHKADFLRGRSQSPTPPTRPPNPTIAAVRANLPPGWRRTLARSKDDSQQGKLMIILHTPTGEKLRTKAELLEYTRLNSISGIGMDVFDFKRAPETVLTPVSAPILVSGNSNVSPGSNSIRLKAPQGVNILRKGPVPIRPVGGGIPERYATDTSSKEIKTNNKVLGVHEIIGTVTNSSTGMKMVRMVVETSSGEKRETLVPAVPGANGTLKIALPKNFSVRKPEKDTEANQGTKTVNEIEINESKLVNTEITGSHKAAVAELQVAQINDSNQESELTELDSETEEPETRESVEPKTRKYVKPETQDPVEPFTRDSVEPETQQPVESVTRDSVEPETKDPVEPVTKDSVEPETQQSVEPVTQDSVEPETQDPVEPVTQDSVEPETQEPVEPVTHNYVEPEIQDSLQPEIHNSLEPETQEAVDSETQDSVEPETQETLESGNPDSVEPETPETLETETQDSVEPEIPKPLKSETLEPIAS